MPKSLVLVLLRIVILAIAVLSLPHFLKLIKNLLSANKNIWKSCVGIMLAVYIVIVLLMTFGFRTEVNGTGIITDFAWGYRIIHKAFASGYEAGGFSEAVRRLNWVRETIIKPDSEYLSLCAIWVSHAFGIPEDAKMVEGAAGWNGIQPLYRDYTVLFTLRMVRYFRSNL